MLSPDGQKFRRLENEIAELRKENERLKKREDHFRTVLVDILKGIKQLRNVSYSDRCEIDVLIQQVKEY